MDVENEKYEQGWSEQIERYRTTIKQLQAELKKHTKRCEKCGNYLLPDDDSEGIFVCACCAASKMQAQLEQLQVENKQLKKYTDAVRKYLKGEDVDCPSFDGY